MKLASIFFAASEIYFRALAQRYNKRARNTKRASIFFTASEIYFRAFAQRYNKRARNMKLASIFFTASEIYFVIHNKDSKKNGPCKKSCSARFLL